MNRVIIFGKLGKDPESKPAGTTTVCNFSIATREYIAGKNGAEGKEHTEWHSITAFGKTADTIAKHLRKGDSMLVSGKLQTQKWVDKDGHERYTTKIIVQDFEFGNNKSTATATQPTPSPSAARNEPADKTSANFDDEIPF